MHLKLKEIVEGWRNKIIPPEELKGVIEEVAKERNIICMQCPHHSRFHNTFRRDEHCTNCGCTLSAKTRCLSCSCPLDPPAWGPVEHKEQ
jgi:transcription initiation factor IIE alpha subunit